MINLSDKIAISVTFKCVKEPIDLTQRAIINYECNYGRHLVRRSSSDRSVRVVPLVFKTVTINLDTPKDWGMSVLSKTESVTLH